MPVPFATVHEITVENLASWVKSISWDAWPQQNRVVSDQVRPAFVTDPTWNGFGARTDNLVAFLARMCMPVGKIETRNRWLSVVMPGASIDAHRDAQSEDWVARVHVPIMTNDRATFEVEGVPFYLSTGFAYLVDTRRLHAIKNEGATPRVHLMFDVVRGSP